MKRLIIVGASGFGRELAAWLSQIPEESRDWAVYGFLDDRSDALDGYDCPVPIVGEISTYVPRPGDCFAMGIGLPEPKLEIARSLTERGAEFVTAVHPSVIMGDRVSLGSGTIVCPYAVLTCDIRIGEFVTINLHASVGHDAVIGPGCTLSSHSDVTGYAKLGLGVFLGSHASILPNAQVGDFAKVGAGSVVIKRVKAGTTVFGVPGKTI